MKQILLTALYVEDGFHDQESNKLKNVILCAPPKTGTTSWKAQLMSMYHLNYTLQDEMNGKEKPVTSRQTNPSLAALFNSKTRSIKFKQNLGKLLVADELTENDHLLRVLHVRHPFRRLYSAWSDKFFDYNKTEVWYRDRHKVKFCRFFTFFESINRGVLICHLCHPCHPVDHRKIP